MWGFVPGRETFSNAFDVVSCAMHLPGNARHVSARWRCLYTRYLCRDQVLTALGFPNRLKRALLKLLFFDCEGPVEPTCGRQPGTFLPWSQRYCGCAASTFTSSKLQGCPQHVHRNPCLRIPDTPSPKSSKTAQECM